MRGEISPRGSYHFSYKAKILLGPRQTPFFFDSVIRWTLCTLIVVKL